MAKDTFSYHMNKDKDNKIIDTLYRDTKNIERNLEGVGTPTWQGIHSPLSQVVARDAY